MKKYVPVIVVAVVLLVVLGVVIGRKSVRVSPAKGSAAATQAADAQKRAQVAAMMQDAQKAYDAKNYEASVAKTREILKAVDNTSQEAKNLLQVSQIRIMELSQAQ